jgi:hypothetical protein
MIEAVPNSTAHLLLGVGLIVATGLAYGGWLLARRRALLRQLAALRDAKSP